MGRAVATKGERRLGRTIRKLEESVEFSPKEARAKIGEVKYRKQTQSALGYDEDSPVQNLRDPAKWKKDQTKP